MKSIGQNIFSSKEIFSNYKKMLTWKKFLLLTKTSIYFNMDNIDKNLAIFITLRSREELNGLKNLLPPNLIFKSNFIFSKVQVPLEMVKGFDLSNFKIKPFNFVDERVI